MGQDSIVYDSRKLAAFGIITDLCHTYGHDTSYTNTLWEALLQSPVFYDEFIYYMQTGQLTGNTSCEGYDMFDLYFYHLRLYNLKHDLGKNIDDCDKDMLIFESFHTMAMLQQHPKETLQKLAEHPGMDI